MLRLSIVTPHHILSLGMLSAPDFFEVLGFRDGDETDTIQIITDDFLQRMAKMKIQGSFSVEYKANFIKCLEKAKDKYCILTDDWMLDVQSEKAKYLFELASELTKKDISETIESVKNRVTQKYNEQLNTQKDADIQIK